jgi:hypothetical protein
MVRACMYNGHYDDGIIERMVFLASMSETINDSHLFK